MTNESHGAASRQMVASVADDDDTTRNDGHVRGRIRPWPALLGLALFAVPATAWAAPHSFNMGPSPVLTVMILTGLGVAAAAFLMVSSFVKIAVVLSILRSAIGLQQIPPASVITGLALILSVYIMAPTGAAMADQLKPAAEELSNSSQGTIDMDRMTASLKRGVEPLRTFLARHAHPTEVSLFLRLAKRHMAGSSIGPVHRRDILVLVPAFVISQLTEAFQIGFLLFIPFLVIDLVVSNVLMALGMHMLSPTTVSLPFKLLLFVMADGWHLLTQGLVASYL